MLEKEHLFRLQTFQYVLSALHMYPIRLYKNDCYERFSQTLFQDTERVNKLKTLVACNSFDNLIPTIQKALKSNPKELNNLIFEILDLYSEDIRKYMWATKPSNSLVFTREIKSNRVLWLHLMLYDIFDNDFINTHFKTPYVKDCLIDMKTVYVQLNDSYSIVIGRLFDEKQDINTIVQNIIHDYQITNADIFELTKLAKKRNFFEIDDIKKDAVTIKKAFTFFVDIMDRLPLEISKEALEKISVYIYMIVQEGSIEETLLLEDMVLSYKDGRFHINSQMKPTHVKSSEDLFSVYYKKYIKYRSFSQDEFTSRLKSFLAKKYTGFEDDDEFYPIKEVIERICGTLNADGGFYIKYHLSRQTFRPAAPYGDSEYIQGISKYIAKINKKDKNSMKKSRVMNIVENYYSAKNYDPISKLILFNRKEHELLQPIENRPIYSNIAIPVTFKHKLLGILLIDSFRKNAFTQNDIQLVLSISNALSIQIYDEIVEKNLLAIIENIPNQTQLDDEKSIESISINLTKYINSIFFSIGVDIWIYQDQHFNRISSTIKNGANKDLLICESESELICNLVKSNIEEISDMDIKNSKNFIRCKPFEADKRINAVKIYTIKQDGKLIGALSVYNQKVEDYLSIDNRSLKSVRNYLKIFFSVIHTFKKQKELVHSHALHDINQDLLMIQGKCQQLTDLLHSKFKYIDKYDRYRFGIKIKDIDRFTNNMKSSFNFITGKGKIFSGKNKIGLQIQEQFASKQKSFLGETKLSDVIYSISNSIEHRDKNLKIVPHIEELYLKIDSILLEDIFSNLIQNAVKYSYQNTTISIKTVTLKYSAQIRVENIGIKIDKDEIDDIFEYKYRGFSAVEFEEEINDEKISYPRGERENSGFGLYKCNILVKLFSGSIKLENSLKVSNGYKNTFLLTIPTNIVNQKKIFKKMETRLTEKFKG